MLYAEIFYVLKKNIEANDTIFDNEEYIIQEITKNLIAMITYYDNKFERYIFNLSTRYET